MKYRDIIGYSEKQLKKKVVKEQKKPTVVDNIKEELNEWNDTTFRNKPKRWSGAYNRKDGLTEFEVTGGKDKINETIPYGAMDKVKFMKYFDLVLKTAGGDKAKIYKVLKRMMPSLDNRVLLYMAQGLEDAVKQITGEG